MKRALYSLNMPCDNKEKFVEAKKMDADGLILDYHDSNLKKLPTRNYYVLQSIKTGIPIIGIAVGQFKHELPFFGSEEKEEVLHLLAEVVQVCSHMKAPMLIVSFTGASSLKTNDQLYDAIRRLRFACKLASSLQVNVGIISHLDKDQRYHLVEAVGHDNILDLTDGFDEWRLAM